MLKKLFYILVLFGVTGASIGQNRLSILTDYKRSAEIDTVFQYFLTEINRTLGPGRTMTLPPDHVVYGIGTFEEAREKYDELTQKSDFIILLGSLCNKGVLVERQLPKPTIGLGILDPYLQELPYSNGKTGINNYAYIWSTQDLRTDLTVFKRIFPFKKLLILVNESTVPTFNEERAVQYMDTIKRVIDTEIIVKSLETDIAQTISTLPANIDAVYISYPDGRSKTDIQQLAKALKERNLPSFSSKKWNVEQGILASISDENDLEQVTRKLSIMIDDNLRGTPLSEMAVNINFKQDLFINAETARDINLDLNFDILFTANLLEEDEEMPTYTLEEVMARALEYNFGINE
jgi:ABC-type uncharacterized transport system substrate-binding protein